MANTQGGHPGLTVALGLLALYGIGALLAAMAVDKLAGLVHLRWGRVAA